MPGVVRPKADAPPRMSLPPMSVDHNPASLGTKVSQLHRPVRAIEDVAQGLVGRAEPGQRQRGAGERVSAPLPQFRAVRTSAAMMWVSIAATSGPTMRTAMDKNGLARGIQRRRRPGRSQTAPDSGLKTSTTSGCVGNLLRVNHPCRGRPRVRSVLRGPA